MRPPKKKLKKKKGKESLCEYLEKLAGWKEKDR